MKKRIISLALGLSLLLGAITGCGSAEVATNVADTAASAGSSADAVNKEGFPIVNEQITLRVFGQQGPAHQPWDTMSMWKKYQEMTNIKLDFTDVLSAEGYDEKKSLMWASDDYDDVFVRAFLTNTEIVKYGTMGILIPLEDMLEEYAPNLSKHIKENPAILSRITAPDGHIYALPALIDLTAARDEK